MSRLTVADHSRDASGMTYVYPVVSRRAGGVSVGINLSPNNACNFRCIYCQVPELIRGTSPRIDLGQLRRELDALLDDIQHGDFMQLRVPEDARTLRDVAFSGNGEPTSSPDFSEAVQVVGDVLEQRALALPVVLITNGTLAAKPAVREGLRKLASIGGRVWFKLDSASREGFANINDTPLDPAAQLTRLADTAELIPTWVQTCLFALDGAAPSAEQRNAYIAALQALLAQKVPLRGVLLYTVARESMQPEAARLRKLSAQEMAPWQHDLQSLGLDVSVSL